MDRRDLIGAAGSLGLGPLRGAGHHEDLFRVTKTGYEPLHPVGDPLVIV